MDRCVFQLSEQLKTAWEAFELVLVNGEGTIHHQLSGAVGLIGLCEAAKRAGKYVALVNCSIFELPEMMLERLKTSVDQVTVREPLSFRYLQDSGIAATQSADCLFLMDANEAVDTTVVLDTASVLYTPGVLTSSGSVPEKVVAEDIKKLTDAGHPVYYWIVEAEDEKLASIAHQAGAKIIPLSMVRWNQVPSLMEAATFVVSGRYHINIFAALSGTPFVPMETNTEKMKGLIELTDGLTSIRSFSSADDISDPALRFLPSRTAIQRCRSLAEKSFSSEHLNQLLNA